MPCISIAKPRSHSNIPTHGKKLCKENIEEKQCVTHVASMQTSTETVISILMKQKRWGTILLSTHNDIFQRPQFYSSSYSKIHIAGITLLQNMSSNSLWNRPETKEDILHCQETNKALEPNKKTAISFKEILLFYIYTHVGSGFSLALIQWIVPSRRIR